MWTSQKDLMFRVFFFSATAISNSFSLVSVSVHLVYEYFFCLTNGAYSSSLGHLVSSSRISMWIFLCLGCLPEVCPLYAIAILLSICVQSWFLYSFSCCPYFSDGYILGPHMAKITLAWGNKINLLIADSFKRVSTGKPHILLFDLSTGVELKRGYLVSGAMSSDQLLKWKVECMLYRSS